MALRRGIVRQLTLAFALAAMLTFPGKIFAAPPPDIVVVMVDDLGAMDERVLDRLPNIKSLFLDEGLRFTSYYSETPLCCPSRASFLTGEHTRHHHVTYNDARLLDPSQTLFTALHDVGYQTALIGKYLNHSERLKDKTPPGYDHTMMMLTLPYGGTPSTWVRDGVQELNGYADRVVVKDSVRWVKKLDPARPFALWATPKAPHFAPVIGVHRQWIPLIEPRYVGDPRCAHIRNWKPADYDFQRRPHGWPLDRICQSLLTVDEMIGTLRDQLRSQGRSPVWVFTSDNGMAWGRDGFPAKNVPEAGRDPLYFSGPGVNHGSTKALLSNIDLGPTLADLGGARMPWADGVSFAPLLRGGPGGRRWMLEDHPHGGRTFTDWGGVFWGIRTPHWHLVARWAKGIGWTYSLYRLGHDPWELHDVKAANRTTFMALRKLFPYRHLHYRPNR